MKHAIRLRRTPPAVRARHGRRTDSTLVGVALPITAALSLVGSALVVGAAFAAAAVLVPVTVPALLAGWAAAIGLTFALPLVVVRAVVAALERTR
ncbi:hypothetical protein [Halorussus halobius]|uniref:hypothetical protein n=1 Tax=Halorussus halobius TaxID=1710537 RepID=UPI0010921925|nr:hypothetical protein [Halorussus halobius]